MCQNNRKYAQYQIIINYLNGDKETINHEEFNNSSYKEMLKLYKETKSQFLDECVTIEFIGVTDTNQTSVLFEKKFINEDLKIKEKAEKIQNSSSLDLINELVLSIENIVNKQNTLCEGLNALNKKQDLILHMIESGKNVTNEIKEQRYNDLHIVREERRLIKDNLEIIKQYFDKLTNEKVEKLNLVHIKNLSKTFIDRTKHSIEVKNSKIEPLTLEKAEQFKIMQEKTYRNFKEKINIMKQLQCKYEKIVQDDANMKIICYNKAR